MDVFENGEAFNVRFMTWNDFKETVLNPPAHGERWNILMNVDCIIGGMDYAVDHK